MCSILHAIPWNIPSCNFYDSLMLSNEFTYKLQMTIHPGWPEILQKMYTCGVWHYQRLILLLWHKINLQWCNHLWEFISNNSHAVHLPLQYYVSNFWCCWRTVGLWCHRPAWFPTIHTFVKSNSFERDNFLHWCIWNFQSLLLMRSLRPKWSSKSISFWRNFLGFFRQIN